ncbi:phosphate signaling complex protein PhoU [Psychrobium sp. 1_MG-2023]|uniref:phosphate signaling complex protein PhoU n=1 Tax=Psychrobium sp. 1_MG-2023 TaxID=3062624 RepID=UPI000C34CD7E|nr:phosphate signaling complex protein PhoU [Psychrobium sp. 1_MG-2023]MDP2560910.1 phosphate signaling complex protein PhoU [Psychrobium sp. 1_MG-2023]PKF55984.1 phosphate transport system regulatory protein PhoU [Alteromonadales bacterium alter-6D02]
MDNLNLRRHISGQFNSELDNIRNRVLMMGGLVEKQLTDAIEAISTLNQSLAEQVINNDRKVNSYEVLIDEECTRIIAKRQPAAGDLRLIFAISKTVADLERIGDSAKQLANVALEKNASKQGHLLVSLENLGRHCIALLHDVLDCFARMDLDCAFEVHGKDVLIDAQYESLMRELMTYMMEDPRAIPSVMEVMWAARSLERVGDRVQNIAEYVIYFIKGKDIRHLDTEQIAELRD